MKEIPARWAQAMVKAGAVDPRNGNPSLTQLARMAGRHTTTVSKLILGQDPSVSAEARQAVAAVLGVDRGELDNWVGAEPAGELYGGPPGSEYLTGRERRALDEVIRLLVERKSGHVAVDAEKSTSGDPATGGGVADGAGPGEKTPARTGGRWLKPVPSVAKREQPPTVAKVARGKKRDGDKGDK